MKLTQTEAALLLKLCDAYCITFAERLNARQRRRFDAAIRKLEVMRLDKRQREFVKGEA